MEINLNNYLTLRNKIYKIISNCKIKDFYEHI